MKSSGEEPPANILLVADDFAISEGVTEGIEQLARAHRISATSAIVTLPDGSTMVRGLRPYVATSPLACTST